MRPSVLLLAQADGRRSRSQGDGPPLALVRPNGFGFGSALNDAGEAVVTGDLEAGAAVGGATVVDELDPDDAVGFGPERGAQKTDVEGLAADGDGADGGVGAHDAVGIDGEVAKAPRTAASAFVHYQHFSSIAACPGCESPVGGAVGSSGRGRGDRDRGARGMHIRPPARLFAQQGPGQDSLETDRRVHPSQTPTHEGARHDR